MKKLDYVVQIDNIGTPLANSITIENVMDFWKLYNNEKSAFRNWYNNKYNILSDIADDHKFDTVINKYVTDNVKNLMNMFKNDQIKNPNNFLPLTKPIAVGGMSTKDIKVFVSGITCFLFNKSVSNVVDLPIPKKTKVKLLANKSGEKAKVRLIYIIEFKNKQYVLKITKKTPYYENEINIYEELNQIVAKNSILKNNVIKIFGKNTLDEKSEKFVITINNENIDVSESENVLLYNVIKKYFKDTGMSKIFCSVLEYNNDYITLYTKQKSSNPVKYVCVLAEKVLDALLYLNVNYGFVHFDLHEDNILINSKDEFKFFDFDLSSTEKNKSTEAAIRRYATEELNETKTDSHKCFERDSVKNGFLCDFFRFMEGLDINEHFCDQDKVQKMIDIYSQHKPKNIDHYFVAIIKAVANMESANAYQKILEISRQNIEMYGRNQKGGAYDKYLKYKQKYLSLKSKIIF
ncbi:serine/threonine protein kinase [Catovirus CTV1]|uniref:Serine/threonine protein kinase n=1 Tax=Catovirus CTV1 TaxID=1977631 RepID=A0A1V0S9H1_9VIRU|nr:serine/threonine protein kinase [Catovirus CTV1]